MDPQKFREFQHEAVHELMKLNEGCEERFHISSWPRWDYDLERGILTFSNDGIPKVLVSIQVIGTTSASAGTWMWAWANESLPANVRVESGKLKAFGLSEHIATLTDAELTDDEFLGWGMTAVAAKILGAQGAYRCPSENGFIYMVYRNVALAVDPGWGPKRENQIDCGEHGLGYATYVCEHLVSNPAQEWFSRERDENHKWPDAWCTSCDAFFQQEGEWNEKNESRIEIKLLCHRCYENLRSMGKFSEGDGADR